MNTAVNRQIVQEGLNRRAAERRDAALEEQARQLRLIINENHARKLRNDAKPPVQPQQPRKAAKRDPAKEQALLREKRAQRAAEAAYCADWHLLLLRVFSPLLFAAFTVELSYFDVIPFGLAAACTVAAIAYSFRVYANRILNPGIYQ